MAAQLMATNLPLRLDAWCSPWASTSLPVPLSPSSSTLTLLDASFSMVRQIRSISASRVINPASASGWWRAWRPRVCARRGVVQGLGTRVFRLRRREPVGAIDGQAEELRVERLGEEVVGTQRNG